MEFTIEFYETDSGRCPVCEFLDRLKKVNLNDFAAVVSGIDRLRIRAYQRPPLSKPIGDDLFELRHVGRLNTRILYFFMKGRRIILVHGIRKKSRTISAKDRKVALGRMRDWLARNPR